MRPVGKSSFFVVLCIATFCVAAALVTVLAAQEISQPMVSQPVMQVQAGVAGDSILETAPSAAVPTAPTAPVTAAVQASVQGMPAGAPSVSALQNQPPRKEGVFFQPVRFTGAKGLLVSIAAGQAFSEVKPAPRTFGFQVLKTYRVCVTGIPKYPGVTLYPTIQVLDRTYPPMGQELDYPIIVELSTEDLQSAIQGKFVTRVIYLENPDTALPVPELNGEQGVFDVPKDADPFAVAKTLGRPVAVLRIGGRGPSANGSFDPDFMFGSPEFVPYEP